jgi:hypothetical protein
MLGVLLGGPIGGSGASYGSGSGGSFALNNCLLNDVQTVFWGDTLSGNVGTYWSAHLFNCTVDHCSTFTYIGPGNVSMSIDNSILANVETLGWLSCPNNGCGAIIYGDHDGFWNSSMYGYGYCYPSFGGYCYSSVASPFQDGGSGHHYLASTSIFRGKGATYGMFYGPPASFWTALKSKTTCPPIAIAAGLHVIDHLTFSRQPGVPRYVSGAAQDLGYYYDALDYTVANVYSDGNITVTPGTAIGIRSDPDPYYLCAGFILRENSTFVSHGTPQSNNVFTSVRSVQEGPFSIGAHAPAR